jgi:hypothetical protein
MVSPLKIWQPSQPKYLWPVLGGLSVLAHIGVLGLSLPYVLTLLQTSGGANSSSVIPIELVASDDTAETTADLDTAELRDRQSESSPTESNQTDANSNSEKTAALDSSNSDFEPDIFQPSSGRGTMSEYNNRRIGKNQTEPTPPENITPDNTQPDDTQPDDTQPDDTQPDDTQPDNRPPGSLPSENQQTTEDPESPSEPESQGPTEPTSEPSPSEPATIGETGENLPSPIQGPSEVSLSIVSDQPPPQDQQYDLKETFPSLSPESDNAIVLNPKDSICDKVIFSSRTWIYRVTVNADGSAARFTPLEPDRESDAIACLLQSAGFVFTPAQQDGTPVMDDNLFLTIQVQ